MGGDIVGGAIANARRSLTLSKCCAPIDVSLVWLDSIAALIHCERLLETTTRVGQARSRRRLGETVEVLVDGAAKKNAGELSGRTRCNRIVNFDGQGQVAVGDLAQVRVTEVLPHSLRGALVAAPEEAVCSSR